MRVETSDGVGIEVTVDDGPGDRAPVLVLHGVTRAPGCLDWLAVALAGERRVLRPAFRGHGGSDRAPGRYDLGGYLADVDAVLDALVDRPVVVVGHSLGGVVGAALAQQRPDDVLAVLLVEPAVGLARPWPDPELRPSGPIIDTLTTVRDEAPSAVAVGSTVEEHARVVAARPTWDGATIGGRYLPGTADDRAAAELAVDVEVVERIVAPPPDHLGAGYDGEAGLPVPGTVLVAARDAADRVLGRRDVEQLAASSGVLVEQLDGAGHDMLDQPAFRPVVLDRLRRVLAAHG